MRPSAAYALFLALVLVVACTPGQPPVSEGGMDIHFCEIADCDGLLVNLTRDASHVACAFYGLDDDRVRRTLSERAAHLVMDDHDPLPGATVVGREGLMHHKFCVINRSLVVTGSHNPGQEDAYNNMVVIRSPPLAERFLSVHEAAGDGHAPRDGRVLFLHDGHLIEAYACPHDACRERITGSLAAAEESVAFALFTFTDKGIASLLAEKHREGVDVWGVIESFQADRYNQYYALAAEGVPVLLEGSPALQHNKVFVIDDKTVITGSYNPTRSAASRNDENVLIIHDRRVAGIYKAALRRIYKDTQNFK